ncbi:unnamed protein product [Callosobruchus maculatus]|nr:unnamed protein product [Callosobruchus maculatus]
MVHQCFICKIYSHKPENAGFSFHRLPTDSDTRDIWLQRLGLKDTVLPKDTRLCSKHFEPDAFITMEGKRTLLKKGALPSCIYPVSLLTAGHCDKDESIVSASEGSPKKSPLLAEHDRSEDESTVTASESLEGSPIKSPLLTEHDRSEDESTVTASEILEGSPIKRLELLDRCHSSSKRYSDASALDTSFSSVEGSPSKKR